MSEYLSFTARPHIFSVMTDFAAHCNTSREALSVDLAVHGLQLIEARDRPAIQVLYVRTRDDLHDVVSLQGQRDRLIVPVETELYKAYASNAQRLGMKLTYVARTAVLGELAGRIKQAEFPVPYPQSAAR